MWDSSRAYKRRLNENSDMQASAHVLLLLIAAPPLCCSRGSVRVLPSRGCCPEERRRKTTVKERRDSDEHYVIDLCDRVLGMKAERQYNKFPFLRGDTGRPLAVDAFYPELKLVIEYHERQHSEAVKFFHRRITPRRGLPRGPAPP